MIRSRLRSELPKNEAAEARGLKALIEGAR
jgi:hypothetical protein